MSNTPHTVRAILLDPYVFLNDDGSFTAQPREFPIRQIKITPKPGLPTFIYDPLRDNLPACVSRAPDMIEAVYPNNPNLPAFMGKGPTSDVIYADEEGRIHETPRAWVAVKGFSFPLAGRAIICGVDRKGDICDAATEVASLGNNVLFGVGGHSIRPTIWEGTNRIFTVSQGRVTMQGVDMMAHCLDIWAHEGWIVQQHSMHQQGLETFGGFYTSQMLDTD